MADSSKGKGGPGPYGLEPHGEPGGEPPSVRALDVCPNCNSPMGPIDTVVCMRCGFDLKSLKVIKTATAPKKENEVEPEEPAEAEPVCRPGAGGLWLPTALGGTSLLLLAIGCLAGAPGLVGGGEEAAGFLARVDALARVIVRTGVFATAGLGGLYVLAQVLQTKMGDVQLAAVRMAGIMAILGLIGFTSVASPGFEWTVESILQGLGFVGLTMLVFRLKLRDALTLLGVTVFGVLVLLLGSMLVQWAAH
jgi:hypothetical protein